MKDKIQMPKEELESLVELLYDGVVCTDHHEGEIDIPFGKAVIEAAFEFGVQAAEKVKKEK